MEEQPKEFRCLICGKPLVQLEEGGHHDADIWDGLFDGGDVWEVICNYGSSHDTNKYIFGLCDDCIDAKVASGLLIPHGTIRMISDPLPPSFLDIRIRQQIDEDLRELEMG